MTTSDTNDTTTGTTDPERPRPDLPFQGSPSTADARPVSPLARRLGPVVAGLAVAVTLGMLLWLGLAPTAIAGPIAEAPFDLDATLVVSPDEDGCIDVVDGDGSSTTHCIPGVSHGEAFFDAQGALLVGEYGSHRVVDPGTGEVLEVLDEEAESDGRFDAPIDELTGPATLLTDGDVVEDADTGEVLLDLEGPPGYHLEGAATSPDGRWVVVLAPDGAVVVAPTDGSAAPYVWVDTGDRGWVDLWRGIRWEAPR